MSSIYQAITAAMAEITPIAKNKRNANQGFAYRGIDDVMNELSPILSKNKIFIYPEVIAREREERQSKSGGNNIYSILTIKYHFATEDGSEVCTTVVGEGMDSGDKGSNKAMAVAFKYACLQMFCIPTEDMEDADKTTPPPSTPKNQNNYYQAANKNIPQKQPPQKPANTETLQSVLDEIKAVVFERNPDNYPYFTENEVEAARDAASGVNLQTLKNLRDRLKKELEKRKAAFKPIPFDDKTPSMYKEPEPEAGEFEDDNPYETGKPPEGGDLDIF